jgi:uncharacterized protein YfiM (DUF2279 family)
MSYTQKYPKSILILVICSVIYMLIPENLLAGEQPKNDSFMGIDKLEHFAMSAAITSSTGFVLHNHFGTKRDDAITIGFGVSFGLGGLKEIVDKKTPGEQSSWKDLVADFIGCAAGALILHESIK